MWRKVQVERPRASTSGGQSGGREEEVVVEVEVEVEVEVVSGFLLAAVVSFFAMASQAETEVQERQLDGRLGSNMFLDYSYCFAVRRWTHGLPSLPSTKPLGRAFFSEAAGSSDSGAGFLLVFWTSLKNLSMAETGSRRGEGEGKYMMNSIRMFYSSAEPRRLVSAKSYSRKERVQRQP